MRFGVVRLCCHTPYICRRINDFESHGGRFLGPFLPYLAPVLGARSIAAFSGPAAILQKTLDEENTIDKKLTSLAEGKVNLRAAN